MAMEQGKVLEAIRRCLALSESSNEHEAAAAAAKAQELLFKYNLSMAQVEAKADSSEEKTRVTKDYTHLQTAKNHGRWKAQLISRVARYNFCDTLFSGDTVIVIGQPHNILVVQELYSWIAEQILRFAATACKTYSGFDRIPTFRRGFLESAALTVANRLYRQWAASKEASEMSTALVVTHEAAVKAYIEETWPVLRKGRMNRGSKSYDGHLAGREAGERVNLTAQKKVENSESKRLS